MRGAEEVGAVAGAIERSPPRTAEYDVIVVGTGPAGASVARNLVRHGKRVLILERGSAAPLRDGLRGLMSVIRMAAVADGVETARGVTLGGTSALYFGAARFPPLDAFQRLGIDLTRECTEAAAELPLEPLREELVAPQVRTVRESALQLGYGWSKTEGMLIDQSRGTADIHSIRWNARRYVEDAVSGGATLLSEARVSRIIVENRTAVGVEYVTGQKRQQKTHRVHGRRVVLCAGAHATPMLLRDCGVQGVAERGFYCDPNFMVMGQVRGLKGTEVFPGSMGAGIESEADGLLLGDGCLNRAFFRAFMLGNGKWMRILSHGSTISVGVMVTDGRAGGLDAQGRYDKHFSDSERARLEDGERQARAILENAGATRIFRGKSTAAHVSGTVSIGELLGSDLQTEIAGLHVCDGTVIPESIRLPPTLTLICLGKYVANRIAPTLN